MIFILFPTSVSKNSKLKINISYLRGCNPVEEDTTTYLREDILNAERWLSLSFNDIITNLQN